MESNHSWNVKEPVQIVVNCIQQCLKDHTSPLVVSIDGGSGAGKSSIASEVASYIGGYSRSM
ncbi:hypothetical protein [Sporosarcina sp. USHLN248]|uniref:hypothetical protein n=1 Tax=Sporosarcina sp. USHLN248 TaxID=3081300 RepID=UPI003016675D